MAINELYKKVISLVPVEYTGKGGIISPLQDTYSSYIQILGQTNLVKLSNHFISGQEKLCEQIISIIRYLNKGCHSDAFDLLKSIMTPLFDKRNSLLVQSANEVNYYRMRVIKEKDRKNIKKEDLFHIPLNKRHIVQPQRFSIPGYPCLYLGASIYDCWEEMSRPLFDLCMASLIRCKKSTLVLLPLSLPESDLFIQYYNHFLEFFPLIIACMIKSRKDDSYYKEEYIFPQLITEWLIARNNSTNPSLVKYDGLQYTSVFFNERDFDFPMDLLTNIVIPVVQTDAHDYCPVLCDSFIITPPTCYEYEVLKRGDHSTIRHNRDPKLELCGQNVIDSIASISPESYLLLNTREKQLTNYLKTKFHFLENALCSYDEFPLLSINPSDT